MEESGSGLEVEEREGRRELVALPAFGLPSSGGRGCIERDMVGSLNQAKRAGKREMLGSSSG